MVDSNANTHRTHTLDDAEVRRAIAGTVCLPCGAVKSRGKDFCASCYAALTLAMRLGLRDGGLAAWRSAARHLELNPIRKSRYSSGAGELPYRTISEFEAAGFRFSDYGKCAAPRCSARVLYFWTRDRKRRFRVNESNMQFHAAACADPEFFERLRALKTSARRKKR